MESGIRKRLVAVFLAMLVVVAGGTFGYYAIGGGRWPVGDCFYMTMISLTTVGYGEVLAGMETVPYARGFTLILLLVGMGVVVYFVSTLTAFIIEGDLRRALRLQRVRKRISRMEKHIIVCGAGSTGRHIIGELIATKTPLVAIDLDRAALEEIAEHHPKADFSYLVGDATDDEVLQQANLSSAGGLVSALPNDKDNLYLVVTARQTSSKLRIVARCIDVDVMDKLRRAGADSVVSPNFIGGMRMVSEMLRPVVVKFLDEMLRDKTSPMRIDEVTIPSGSPVAGTSLGAADLRKHSVVSVLAMRPQVDAGYVYNPGPEVVLTEGMVLVVLGSVTEVGKLRKHVAD
jgi:voltage-gated potassium channel